MEVLPSVPYEKRPDKFVVFPYSRPKYSKLQLLWYYCRVFEWGWKRIIHFIGPEYLAEFFGTLVFLTLAIGGAAQAFLIGNSITDWLGGSFSASIGLVFGLYVAAGLSGGHLNPAITLGLASVGKFPFWKVPLYWLAQVLGSFMSAVVIYLYYNEAINAFDGGVHEFNGVNETYRIWTTNPQASVSNLTHFWDQLFSTFLFQFLILAIVDRPNSGLIDYLRPAGVGLIVFALAVGFSYNCGGGVNPARDFPPRCFAAITWGIGIFTIHDYYFWIPIVAPLLGAPLGAFAYVFFIETHNYPAEKPVAFRATMKIVKETPEARE